MRIARIINRLLHVFGCHISRLPPKSDTHKAGQYWDIRPIKALQLEIKTAIDVGTAYGTPPLLDAFPDAFLLLIEPLVECKPAITDILRERRGEHVDCAVGSKSGKTSIFVDNRKIIKTSILHRDDSLEVQERCVDILTLDSIVCKRDLDKPYAVKIDVEGAEYDVLQGSRETLRDTAMVIIEVNMDERYGAMDDNLPKIDSLLRDSGFTINAILDASMDNGKRIVKKADLLYVRQQHTLDRPEQHAS